MKRLELNNMHESLGAKMIDFGGFYMPVQYEGIKIEHNTVRNNVGVFDVSHMGEIIIEGEDSLDLLQYITSNNILKLNPGKVQYSYLPNNNGGIIDDLLVYMISDNKYLLVVNASNIKKDLEWINNNNTFNCNIIDKSDEYSLLAIQGPNSLNLLKEISNEDISSIKYYNFIIGSVGDIDNVIISRTGYTGEIGFELYVKNHDVEKLWNTLFTTDFDLKPIGLAARDTLRLEKGFCLYGNDINDNTSPIEAGLSWITSFAKDFVGKDKIEKVFHEGPNKKLVGIELIEKGIARKDYQIISDKGNRIGYITSGTMSPTMNKPIAMGYIDREFSELETKISILIRNKKISAKVISFPFC